MRRLGVLVGLVVLLAACGGAKNNSGSLTSSTAGASRAAGTPITASPVAASRGELKVAVGFLNATLDPTKDGYAAISHELGETLTRITPDLKLQPWLAESVTAVDPLTWRVSLRKNAQFWDGSPVTASDVAASFHRDWDTQPAANALIPKDTQVTAIDSSTLEFKTAAPVAALPNNLAAFYFVVHKPGNKPNEFLMTGPYRPTSFQPGTELDLEAFPGHWAGPPPLAKISIKLVTDIQARILAVQAGDVDVTYGLAPQDVASLSGDVQSVFTPSVRTSVLALNTTRPPFDDVRVRMATSFAIDRASLNQATLDGKGTPVTDLFPPSTGVPGVGAQTTDVKKAAQLLDDAGWKMGSDGVRAKDGNRLAFTLITYAGYGNLTGQAVAVSGQLRPLGYDVKVQTLQDYDSPARGPDFVALLVGFNVLPTGDPSYILNNMLSETGSFDYSRYSNPQVEALIQQLRVETGGTKRDALVKQIEAYFGTDVPYVVLVSPPQVAAYRKNRVQNFVLHPNDLYVLNRELGVK